MEIILNDLKNVNAEDIELTDMINLPFIKGEKGEQGLPGEQGMQGKQGKSAYEIALDNGFVGTEVEWLESLKAKEALNVEIEKDGFGNYIANYNDNDINNARNSGKVVQAKYYNDITNQTYTYYYSTMESDRKPTFIRTYVEGNKVIQVLASVSYDKKVTVKKNIVDVDKLIEPVNNKIQENTNKNIEQDTEIEKIKSNLIHLSAEGENISVNDSSDLNASITLRGNTNQETTEGYNLCPNELQTTSLNGLTFTVNEDKSITVNGTATKETTVFITKNLNLTTGDYYFSGCIGGSPGTYNMTIFGLTSVYNGERKETIETNKTYSVGIVVFANQKMNNVIYKPMVTKIAGNSYEPYTGGKASPNPDYPQEIESVTGNVEIKQTNLDGTQEKKYPLTLGNNDLNGTSDLKDSIYKENGKWYFDKKWNKYIFTGNEKWTPYEANCYFTYIEDKKPGYFNSKCNRFTEKRAVWVNNEYGKYSGHPSLKAVYFSSLDLNVNSVQDWKQYLTNNRTELIYELETPEKIEITDPILIEQLEALANTETYKPTTNLTSNSIVDMKLDYIADTKAYIDNIIATTNKAIVTSEGGN